MTGNEHKVQMSIFRLLSVILDLGNVVIDQDEHETTFIKESDRSFLIFSTLIKFDENRMRTWLCNKRIWIDVELVNTILYLKQVLFSN